VKVYNYDRITKEFIGEKDANLDPIDGKPLCPANATFKPIPFRKHLQKDVAICFIDDEWVEVVDKRGIKLYDKETKEEHILKELGEIPSKYTILEPKRFDKWDEKLNKWIGHDEGQKKWDATEYRRDRMRAYLPIHEQLDMIYWDRRRLTDNWIRHIEEVKSKYPKPEEKDV
tara:strand:+ start:1294 stop:1809 length:516 start_codon:yes stop_codon:yes gene_type:complete